MSGDPGPDPTLAELRDVPAAMLRAADVLGAQRGQLRLIGELSTSMPRVVVSGVGASLAVGRAFGSMLTGVGVDARALRGGSLERDGAGALDAGTMLVVASRSGDQSDLCAGTRAALDLRSRPLVVAVLGRVTGELADIADVVIATGSEAGVGPPTRSAAATAVVLATIARMRVQGAAADVDAVLAEMDDIARHAAGVAAGLIDLPVDRVAALAEICGGRASLLATGRGGGRAAADLAALAWWTTVGSLASIVEASDLAHGSLEAVGDALATLVFSTDPPAARADRALAVELGRAGSAVVFIGADAPPGIEAVPVEPVDPVLDPVLASLVVHVIARAVATGRGRVAGPPTRVRGLDLG
jgi:fructoselysine-6-P-deglycase FrlB-like protein